MSVGEVPEMNAVVRGVARTCIPISIKPLVIVRGY